MYTLAGVQALLDMQQSILCQYKEVLEEQGGASCLTIPRHRDKDNQERRRLETESLKNFKLRMDKEMSCGNILYNICDL